MNIKEDQFVTWAEAKRILEQKSEGKELGYEQKNAVEFLRKFAKLSDKKTKELIEELGKIEKLKDRHKIAIVNMLPETPEDLKALFQHDILNLSEEEGKKVLETVRKYA